MTTTNHPMTEITDEMCDAAVVHLWGRALNDRKAMRAALSAALAAIIPSEPLARTLLGVPEGHGAPHHDVKEIKAEDFVLQVDYDGDIRHGIAHHQDKNGNWRTEDGGIVTWASYRANRPDALTVWPTAPPAEVVEMPTEPGSVLTDVSLARPNGVTVHAAAAMLDDEGYWLGQWDDGEEVVFEGYEIGLIIAIAFTLPDGTRARRDGEREDGKPRFIKVREGEK